METAGKDEEPHRATLPREVGKGTLNHSVLLSVLLEDSITTVCFIFCAGLKLQRFGNRAAGYPAWEGAMN